MKRILSITAAVLMLSSIAMDAQTGLRYNYRKNKLVYTGTDRVRVDAPAPKDLPVHVKLSRVLFDDGQPVYIIRLDFEDVSAWKMPVNAPLTIVTKSGRQVLLKNSADSPNLVAPQGFRNESGKTVFLNYGEYYLEEADMQKLDEGIVSIDATKRWSSDGSIKISYKGNEFGNALSSQYKAIKSAPVPTSDLGSNLRSLQDQRGSRLVETNTVKVSGGLAVSMVYLYYANSNSESIDLNLSLEGSTVPFTSGIRIVTGKGETIMLKQEKDLPAGKVICYPSLEQVRMMSEGVARMSIQTTSGEITIAFPSDEFGRTVKELYNSLMTVSVL